MSLIQCLSVEWNLSKSMESGSKILPIIKDSKFPMDGQNSRPITILSILSKLIEKIVFKKIQDYCTSNNLMDNSQHGFVVGHSTALVKMTDVG